MRGLLLLFLLSLTLPAQTIKYEDVHIWAPKNVGQEAKRRDGVLNIVPQAKVLVTIINAEDEVVDVIPYSMVRRVEYFPKDGNQILLTYTTIDGADKVVRWGLHGGNYDRIVKSLTNAGFQIEVNQGKLTAK